MLTRAWTKLRYHEKQSRLWRSPARFVEVAAGRGSGKTELARRRIVRMLPVMKPWPDPMYFYALPTYNQARRVAWRNILKLIPPDWLKSQPNQSNMRIDTVFGSSLYVVGLDKPQRIEGDQWDGCVIDESCDQRPKVFDLSVLPALSHKNGWCWRIGVPKRTGTGAQEFKEAFMRPQTREHESYCWPSSDILTPDQLKWAKENLDPKDFAEQYGAMWQDPSGLCFYAFDEVHSVDSKIEYDPTKQLLVGSDFNVDPMAWVIAQRRGPRCLEVLDEIFVRNTNTQDTLNRLFRKWGHHKGGFEFFGDASGQARKTSASQSDYIQIRNDKRFEGARVFYPKSNPRITDRFAACNALFCNADGARCCKVHPRCVNLIRDLTFRAYKEGGNEPDDYGDVGHISDALGYIIHRIWPMRYEAPTDAPQVLGLPG
jgi:hypothetical protein